MSGTSWEMIHEFALKKNAKVNKIEQENKDDEDDNKTGQAMVCQNSYMGGESSSMVKTKKKATPMSRHQ
jgi:hypothetical protein